MGALEVETDNKRQLLGGELVPPREPPTLPPYMSLQQNLSQPSALYFSIPRLPPDSDMVRGEIIVETELPDEFKTD